MKPARKSSTAKIDTPSPGDKGKPLNATRLLIIDTAERLFAAHGISGVSLRQIIAEADVNLASIHYYFGTKNALFEAVFERRAKAITAERSRRLKEFRSRPTPPELEDVLTAFLEPGLRPDSTKNEPTGGAMFARLRARLMADDVEFARDLQVKYFNESTQEFIRLLEPLLPHLSQAELYWRLHFMLGSMVYQMAGVDRINQISEGQFSSADNRVAMQRMVSFYAAGFRLPEKAG